MPGPSTLTFRPLDRDQIPAWTRLLAAIEAEDKQEINVSEDELAEDFDDPDYDFPAGSIAAYQGEVMVGYARLICRSAADPVHNMYQDAAVHPAHRGGGIGTTLLRWAERAAVGLHESRFPGSPLALHATYAAGNASAVALFAAHGYREVRWFHLMRAWLPAGGEWSVAAAAQQRGIRIAGFDEQRSPDALFVRNEAFRDHWGSTVATPESFAHLTGSSAFRPSASFVGYGTDGEPLGVLLSMEFDGDTAATGVRELYIQTVGTIATARRQGIATALLVTALATGAAAGYDRAALHVDADSPTGAVGLYQRAGFSVVTTSVTVAKELHGTH